MYNLGLYYKEIEDYEQMKKYYIMAIDNEHAGAKLSLELFNSKF